MVAFIDAHRDAYGVVPICAQLPIAASTYYEAKAREVDPQGVPAGRSGTPRCVQRSTACGARIGAYTA